MGLLDPPRRVGREAAPSLRVELLHRLHQTDVALLDQVHEGQAPVHVVLGDGDDEPQIRTDHVLPRLDVTSTKWRE